MATPQPSSIKMSIEPQTVTWPETHYIFLESIGPFMETAPKTWQALHAITAAFAEHNKITGYMSLYKVGPQIYRAGVAVAEPPANLTQGLRYEKFEGGKYTRFVLTGSYAQLPEACGRAFDIVAERKIPFRDGFNIENYVNDPRTTPEAELVTEILIATA